MKKLIIIICLVLVSICLTGCYDKTKDDMMLLEVKVKDSSENEVVGEYKSIRDILIPDSFRPIDKVLLNSAPARLDFYVIKAIEGEEYTVTLILASKKGYNLDKVIMKSGTRFDLTNEFEVTDIEKVDGKFYATFKIIANHEIVEYDTFSWYGGSKHQEFGCSAGNNQYYRGLFLDFDVEEV